MEKENAKLKGSILIIVKYYNFYISNKTVSNMYQVFILLTYLAI